MADAKHGHTLHATTSIWENQSTPEYLELPGDNSHTEPE